MMKKYLVVLTAMLLALVIGLSGCGSQVQTSSESIKEQAEKVEKTQKKEESEEKVSDKVATEQKAEEETVSTEAVSQTQTEASTNVATPSGKKSEQTNVITQQKASTSTTTPSPSQSTTTTTQPKQEEKKEEQPVTPPAEQPKAEPLLNVSMSIQGPSDLGTILKTTTVQVKAGETIFSVLLSVANSKGIQVDYSGKGALAYVEGIQNVYEFDYGPRSGWTCLRNGSTIEKSSGAIQVQEGDHIEWVYTEDYTE
jgi:cytoskeletal protein RodZ